MYFPWVSSLETTPPSCLTFLHIFLLRYMASHLFKDIVSMETKLLTRSQFKVYFWCTVACSIMCGLILVLNASLKGKFHYRFQNSFIVWFFLYNVGSPMFVSFVTILFMALWCDFTAAVPTLIQEPNLVCYSEKYVQKNLLRSLALFSISSLFHLLLSGVLYLCILKAIFSHNTILK